MNADMLGTESVVSAYGGSATLGTIFWKGNDGLASALDAFGEGLCAGDGTLSTTSMPTGFKVFRHRRANVENGDERWNSGVMRYFSALSC